TRVRRLFPRSAQDRPGSVPRRLAALRQRRSRAADGRRYGRRGCAQIAAYPERERRDLRAVRRLGRGGGRGFHPPLRAKLDAVGGSQPERDDVSELLDATLKHLRALVACDTRNPPRAIGTGGIFDYLRAQLPGFACTLTDHGAGAVSLLALRGKPR